MRNIECTIEIDGRMRPVINSSGRQIAHSLESIISFWRYFGDSKVVDTHGRPLVVYHGSPTCSIDSFNHSYEGSNTGAADEQHGLGGFYFSDDPNVADTYARTIDVEMANIAEQEFNIKPRCPLPESTTYPVYLSMGNPFHVKSIVTRDVLSKALEGGHDGIIANLGSQIEYVAFNPGQIKSSIGNPGTYLINSASLTDWRTLVIGEVPKPMIITDYVNQNESEPVRKRLRP
jgi:hypothetical protein